MKTPLGTLEIAIAGQFSTRYNLCHPDCYQWMQSLDRSGDVCPLKAVEVGAKAKSLKLPKRLTHTRANKKKKPPEIRGLCSHL